MSALSKDRVYVIAEAGVNHNGDFSRAKDLVDAAADAKADAVKFQTFRADLIATASAPKAAYQVRETGAAESQHAMLRRLELDHDSHRKLAAHCRARAIDFLSTPFDTESLAFLADGLGLKRIKIGSGDLTNAPLLLDAARRGLPVILSTGMATMDEVAGALGALAFGYAGMPLDTVNRTAFAAALREHGDTLPDRVTLLHCTTDYPTAPEDVNLRAMLSLRERFGVPVGYSDHSEGLAVSIAAAAMGARVIEKHFTMDRSLPGPDHKASLEPDELKELVESLRIVEHALGNGDKQPRAAELANRNVARKSVVAARAIAKGVAISTDDLCIKRPGNGIAPDRVWDLIGRRADRDYAKEELLDPCLLP